MVTAKNGGNFVFRRVADIRISRKRKGGKTHRIELIRPPSVRRYWVVRDRKKSAKLPEATATQIAEAIRKWLAAEHDKPWSFAATLFDR